MVGIVLYILVLKINSIASLIICLTYYYNYDDHVMMNNHEQKFLFLDCFIQGIYIEPRFVLYDIRSSTRFQQNKVSYKSFQFVLMDDLCPQREC